MSVASEALEALGGVGIYIDFVDDSISIADGADPADPALNYNGTASGKLTFVSAKSIGPNGGWTFPTAGGCYVNLSEFPFDYDKGTIGLEFIRDDLSIVEIFLTFGLNDAARYQFRTSATTGNIRFETDVSVLEMAGTRLFENVATNFIAAYANGDAVASYDGCVNITDDTIVTPRELSTLRFHIHPDTLDPGHVEFLSAWYVPRRMTDEEVNEQSICRSQQTFYVDSTYGDDANDGLSSAEAKLTLDNVMDEDETSVRHSDIIKMSGRFHESPISLPTHVYLQATDQNHKPVIDGSRLISNGSWAADGTYSNVYKVTISHETNISPPSLFYPSVHYGNLIGRDHDDLWSASTTSITIGTGSKTFTVALNRDFRVGDRVFIRDADSYLNFMHGTITAYSGRTLTVSVATINGSGTLARWMVRVTTELVYRAGADSTVRGTLTPGSFAVEQTATAAYDVGSYTDNLAEVRYYVYLPDSSNPASATGEIAYAEQHNIITLNGTQTFEDIIVQRTSAKDMINKNAGDTGPTTLRCEFLNCGAHAIVASPSHHTNDIAVGNISSRASNGGGFHFFRDEDNEGVADACTATNCTAIGFGIGFYSHGTAGGFEQESVTLTDCTSVDCSAGIDTGRATNGWTVNNHTYINCQFDFILNFAPDTEIVRPVLISTEAGSQHPVNCMMLGNVPLSKGRLPKLGKLPAYNPFK